MFNYILSVCVCYIFLGIVICIAREVNQEVSIFIEEKFDGVWHWVLILIASLFFPATLIALFVTTIVLMLNKLIKIVSVFISKKVFKK